MLQGDYQKNCCPQFFAFSAQGRAPTQVALKSLLPTNRVRACATGWQAASAGASTAAKSSVGAPQACPKGMRTGTPQLWPDTVLLLPLLAFRFGLGMLQGDCILVLGVVRVIAL